MLLQDLAKIHPVKLVPGKNDDVLIILLREIAQVLADRVGCSLIPARATRCLLRGEDFDKTPREPVERIALMNVPVQRGRVELREDVNVADV